jgi:hypothetical protein
MHRKLVLTVAVVMLSLSPTYTAPKNDGELPGFAAVVLPSGLNAENADLVVRGRIVAGATVYLDLQTIMSFPSETFSTIDPWDGKVHRFTGVNLERFLDRLGIEKDAGSLLLKAKNNYSIAIKREDYERYGYILAWAIDGQLFGVDPTTKKRGPVAVAIDFSSNKNLDTEIYKHQLIWHVIDILVQ